MNAAVWVFAGMLIGLAGSDTGRLLYSRWADRRAQVAKQQLREEVALWFARAPKDQYNEACDWYVDGPHAGKRRTDVMRSLGDPHPGERII